MPNEYTRHAADLGMPSAEYGADVVHDDPVPPGTYVDWRSDTTRRIVYGIRNAPVVTGCHVVDGRRTHDLLWHGTRAMCGLCGAQVQPSHGEIAARFGFQHPIHSYRATDCWARRMRDAVARGTAARRTTGDYRSYSRRPAWSAQGAAAAAAADPQGRYRHFGIEIESFDTMPNAHRIERAAAAAGLTFTGRWGNYHAAPTIRGWQGTYDGSVSGGTEIISDVLVGDAASVTEVSTMLRIIRDHGGRADAGQGMHTNHDVRDFTSADKARLIRNLRAVVVHLDNYLPPTRRNSTWCRPLADSEWDMAERNAAAGRPCGVDRYRAFNLNHLMRNDANARIEFRQLGHTLNGRKVGTWIRVGQAIMAATKAGRTLTAGISQSQFLYELRTYGGLSDLQATRFVDEVERRAIREGRLRAA